MTSESLPCLESGSTSPQHTIVWLHGLGTDGNDLIPLAEALPLSGCGEIRHVFPHAPLRHIEMFGNQPLRAWYRFDIRGFGQGESTTDLQEVISRLESFLMAERSKLPPSGHLLLGGFSQGGMVALATSLSGQVHLDGLIALSAYCRVEDTPAARLPPVFMAHGADDTIIPMEIARRSSAWLKHQGANIEWHEYPMEHSVCNDEILDLARWIRAQIC